ncbi:MAG: OmpA family protein [Spirochaetes bacterium]|nr:OmpA family protein [Spirochaetota bacterium]
MSKYKHHVIIILIISSIFSCGKEYVKDSGTVNADNRFINAANEQLAKYPVAGFRYKSSKLPDENFKSWSKAGALVVKAVVDKIPEGYVLEIRGHTDATGPEEPEDSKPGNILISKDRAKTVYDAIKKIGIQSSKITYRGVGSSEAVQNAPENDDDQRRVTFKCVPR